MIHSHTHMAFMDIGSKVEINLRAFHMVELVDGSAHLLPAPSSGAITLEACGSLLLLFRRGFSFIRRQWRQLLWRDAPWRMAPWGYPCHKANHILSTFKDSISYSLCWSFVSLLIEGYRAQIGGTSEAEIQGGT